jgi:hypothetical protein
MAVEWVRGLNAPLPLKYMLAFAMMAVWKWFYYAPNTYKELKILERKKLGLPVTEDMGADEPFTIKAFTDRLVPNAPSMHMWYSFGDLMKNVSSRRHLWGGSFYSFGDLIKSVSLRRHLCGVHVMIGDPSAPAPLNPRLPAPYCR